MNEILSSVRHITEPVSEELTARTGKIVPPSHVNGISALHSPRYLMFKLAFVIFSPLSKIKFRLPTSLTKYKLPKLSLTTGEKLRPYVTTTLFSISCSPNLPYL